MRLWRMDADIVELKYLTRPCPASSCALRSMEARMTPTAEQVAPHIGSFLDMLDAAFRRYGVADGLPERFRHAVAACPRHMFVHRFRLGRVPWNNSSNDDDLRDA